jgi:hypothetical protein
MSTATAALAASIRWLPEGPLPRVRAPAHVSSMLPVGPVLERVAPCRVRVVPGGGIVVLSAPDPESGASVAVALSGSSVESVLRLSPDAPAAGWRLLDLLPAAGGGWTVLELVPGSPDHVVTRAYGADGEARSAVSIEAGSPDAPRQLLGVRDGRTLAVIGTSERRVVALGDGGTEATVLTLERPGGELFMNGAGAVGYVSFDPATEIRSWVTVELDGSGQTAIDLAAAGAWGLDVPIGMDAQGRPYGNRYGTLVRFDAGGAVDWQYDVRDVAIAGEDIWISQPGASGAAPVARELRSGRTVPLPVGDDPAWRLLVRPGDDDRLAVYLPGDGSMSGSVTTVAPDGSPLGTVPASADVWLDTCDGQLPSGASVTDLGDVVLATRCPSALHLVLLKPG